MEDPQINKQLQKLKLKRYCSEYEYLENEYNETKFLFEIYNKKFLEDNFKESNITEPVDEENKEEIKETVEESINEKVQESINKEVKESITEDIDDDCTNQRKFNICDIVENNMKDKDKVDTSDIKKLYKKLSLKTHPDKGGNKDIFKEVALAFKDNDLLKLILLSLKYDIDINDIEISTDSLEKSILNIKEKINNFKRTLAWNWATGTDEQRESYRKFFNF